MAFTVASIMNRAMEHPDLLVVGVLAGFILAKLHSRRSGMGGIGGGL